MIRFSLALLTLIIIVSCGDNDLVKDEGDLLKESPITTVPVGESIEEIINTFSEVKDYQDILLVVGKRDHKNLTIIQELDFGMSLIREDVYNKNSLRVSLKYLVRGDEVGYGVITSIDSNYHTLASNVLFHKDKFLLQDYVDDHNDQYGAKYNEHQLIEELIENSMELRIACGNATNSYGATEIKLFQAVQNRDDEFIIEMLRSVSPERQALGVIGVNKMIETKKKVSAEMARARERILRKNPLISACVSCTNGLYSLTDYLSKYYWDQIPNIELE